MQIWTCVGTRKYGAHLIVCTKEHKKQSVSWWWSLRKYDSSNLWCMPTDWFSLICDRYLSFLKFPSSLWVAVGFHVSENQKFNYWVWHCAPCWFVHGCACIFIFWFSVPFSFFLTTTGTQKSFQSTTAHLLYSTLHPTYVIWLVTLIFYALSLWTCFLHRYLTTSNDQY